MAMAANAPRVRIKPGRILDLFSARSSASLSKRRILEPSKGNGHGGERSEGSIQTRKNPGPLFTYSSASLSKRRILEPSKRNGHGGERSEGSIQTRKNPGPLFRIYLAAAMAS